MKKIAVLGAGAFGIALSKLSSTKSKSVKLWTRQKDICDHINKNHFHPNRLSSIKMENNIFATCDIDSAIEGANIIILAVPFRALPEIIKKIKNHKNNAIIISTSKGIDNDRLYLPNDIFKSELESQELKKVCFLSGPSFAIEMAQKMPTAVTVAANCLDTAKLIQKQLSQPYFRIYVSTDVTGACIGGALKNIIAIAAGACRGLNLGRNALAAMITRGLSEMMRLARKMGAKTETLGGLSGMGDLVLSCTDEMSRNFQAGVLFAHGSHKEKVLSEIGQTVEGIYTALAIPKLCLKYNIEMPISMAVYRVLYENGDVKSNIQKLLSRELKSEINY
jgi:glycerol-3-phosphate dehydrogenase (NAD(P)+)